MKVNISINCYLDKRHITESLIIDLAERTKLKEAIKEVETILKVDLRPLVSRNTGNILFLLNGQTIKLPNDLNRKLNDVDQVSILQAVGGG